jgi:hypothetical protein
MQLKEGMLEGFAAVYGCKRLRYFEGDQDTRTAISREKPCMKRCTHEKRQYRVTQLLELPRD